MHRLWSQLRCSAASDNNNSSSLQCFALNIHLSFFSYQWFISFHPVPFFTRMMHQFAMVLSYLAQVGFISKELISFQLPLKHDLVTNHTTQNYRAIETQMEIDKVENKENSGIWFIEKMRGPFILINFNSSMDKSLYPLWSVEISYFSSITKLHRWTNWCFEMDK